MMTLVYGGVASGKSLLAERLATLMPDQPRYYLAAMHPKGIEAVRRIATHRAQRAGLGFVTIEYQLPQPLPHGSIPAEASVLLECLGNLVANTMFAGPVPLSAAETSGRVTAALERLHATAKTLVVVGNDLFADGMCYDTTTTLYMQALAAVQRTAACMSDRVIEVVCGCPLPHKGTLPEEAFHAR